MKGIEAIKKFKEKHGPVPRELTEWIRFCNTSISAIKKTLKEGPKSVPEISDATKVAAHDVLWFVNAMRKYGDAVITGDEDGFKKYGLKDEKNG